MFKIKNLLVFGLVPLIALAALVYFVLVPGLDIHESPIMVQSVYYTVMTKTGRIDVRIKSAFMKDTHRAIRIRKSDEKTPYTFEYTKDDVEIIEKDSRRCRACHGSMLQTSDGKPRYPLHEAMMTARLLSFHCTDCHKTVDLGRRTPGSSKVRVDRTLCTQCHEGDQDTEPTELMNVKIRRPSEIPSRYLISNHGIDKASGRRWVERHGKVAPRIGVNKCHRCHDKGSELDFCGDCHGREVPKIKAQ